VIVMDVTEQRLAELREQWKRQTEWTLANIACPRCGAPAGQPCVSRNRFLLEGMHAPRHRLAYRLGFGER